MRSIYIKLVNCTARVLKCIKIHSFGLSGNILPCRTVVMSFSVEISEIATRASAAINIKIIHLQNFITFLSLIKIWHVIRRWKSLQVYFLTQFESLNYHLYTKRYEQNSGQETVLALLLVTLCYILAQIRPREML